jgi:hypothetical protein
VEGQRDDAAAGYCSTIARFLEVRWRDLAAGVEQQLKKYHVPKLEPHKGSADERDEGLT